MQSLGRNRLTGTIPTELGMLQKLLSLSLQWNDLSGTIPEHYLKNLPQLKALQVEGNEKLIGKIGQHNLLCQMRNKCECPNFLSLGLCGALSRLIRWVAHLTSFFKIRFQDHGPPPRDQEEYIGKGRLRIFTATCVPLSGSDAVSDRLECACCTESFGKTTKDSLYWLTVHRLSYCISLQM